ncbi:D-alanine--D-alanine ligase family protein [Tenuibacillus multivorans]|uniref:D-alanine--D-alanine ligase n=1 Tax=Tenuibacillus multivorans TaxID=237069 RepID=A0A1H0CWY9_9BACI|nr:D-alanine--D-alanine ligase [Tenuibacillus multivorans]GEL76135.1 D-alanine--D-alanine ligase [Tenuibacillus multivorans]SDN62316.1 D-alanine-D-alanine ligase [Tenuibacillus multivorans]
MKIAVLYGGTSKEREVSLSSGKGIIQALSKRGHDVVDIDFNPKDLEDVMEKIKTVDLVFIGLHGKQGEDGTVQGLLDLMGVPYVGSGVLASSLAMDKTKAKQIFYMNGIPIAKGNTYGKHESQENIVEDINQQFSLPIVIKPNQEGSTLGLTIVSDESQVKPAVELAFEHDFEILVEEYVKGREMTCAVIGKRGQEQSLPIIEIIPKSEYYDYESKYSAGGSEHICPAKIDETLTTKIQDYAVKAHQILGCETYSRVDFILKDNGDPIILEVNTLPGMTPTSLYPDAAKAVDMNYEEMLEQFIQLTIKA